MSNEIIRGADFYISYQPNTYVHGSMFAGDSAEETALVKDRDFRILNGDWRAQYKPLIASGFAACLKLFDENRELHGSSWTTPGLYP